MAEITIAPGANFTKKVFNKGIEVLNEKETFTLEKLKIKTSTAINASTPKVIAINGIVDNLIEGKIFSQYYDDIIIGVAINDANANDEIFIISKGIINTNFTGNVGDAVYANDSGELTTFPSNCKVGFYLGNNNIYINIGKESSDNILKQLYDYINPNIEFPKILKRLSLNKVGLQTIEYPPGEETHTYNSLAHNDKGLIVGVGSSGSKRVLYSNNYGKTWTTQNGITSSSWKSVVYGNGIFVAVSDLGPKSVMTSIDGIFWEEKSAPPGAWKEIAYGNNTFVAIKNNGSKRLMYSTDGDIWNDIAIPLEDWKTIAFGLGVFVAYSTDGVCIYSSDGITWNTGTSPFGSGIISKVKYSKYLNKLLVINNLGALYESSDGNSWTNISSLYIGYPWYSSLLNIIDFLVEDNMFIASSSSGRVYYKALSELAFINYGKEPYTEDDISINISGSLSSLIYTNGVFVGINNGGSPNKIYRTAEI